MKGFKFLITLVCALLFSAVSGAFVASAVGIAPYLGSIVGAGVSCVMPSIEGVRADVFREVWSAEMVKKLRDAIASIGWINRITSYDQYVQSGSENSVIHLTEIGVDPDVLINNTTYPIPVQDINDKDVAISLDKYQTKATAVTDDELYACSYDKMGVRIESHKEAILANRIKKSAHAIAPSTHKEQTPVILTTGTADGTRKQLTRQDIVSLKKAFDAARIPTADRILILCPDHVADLLNGDQKFVDQYYKAETGKIANMLGFEVYEYVDCPYYTVATKTKKAFGAVPTAADHQASVAFYAKDMFKATGITKMYYSKAEMDPLTQRNLVNFRNYFICLPKVNRGIGAIVSASV